jgi:hypothetical protein
MQKFQHTHVHFERCRGIDICNDETNKWVELAGTTKVDAHIILSQTKVCEYYLYPFYVLKCCTVVYVPDCPCRNK